MEIKVEIRIVDAVEREAVHVEEMRCADCWAAAWRGEELREVWQR